MKTKTQINVIVALIIPMLSSPMSTQADSLRLFNSGTDSSGNVLPVGSVDPHITIVDRTDGIPSTLAYVVDPGGVWLTNDSTSGWLSARPNPFEAVNAEWTYRVPIDLTGYDPSTARINVAVTSDNEILWTRLNGLDLAFSTTGEMWRWYDLSLTNGFTNGINNLDFRVGDWGIISGFRVELVGTATTTAKLSIRVSQVELCWDTVSNSVYQLQYRSSLTTNIWLPLGSTILGDGTRFCTNDSVLPALQQKFYQLLITNSP